MAACCWSDWKFCPWEGFKKNRIGELPTYSISSWNKRKSGTKMAEMLKIQHMYLFWVQVNEGTTFSHSVRSLGLSGATEQAAFLNFIGHLVIDNSTLTNDVLDKFIALYPANDPVEGAARCRTSCAAKYSSQLPSDRSLIRVAFQRQLGGVS